MNKCDCYKTVERLCYTPFYTQAYYKTVGICYGTKEREECFCNGDETKCNFYSEVRERALRKNNIVEYDFKVGDKVITSTGEVGIIESICDCDSCKARGFCEPTVKINDCDNRIYITDFAKDNGFKSFYQIGKYKFGNIDIESVERSIEYEKERVDEAIHNTKKYMKQLKRLKKLEAFKEINENKEPSKEGLSLEWLL